MNGSLTLLIDTNVWLDHFLGRSNTASPATDVLTYAAKNERVMLTYASTTAKDVFFLVGRILKQEARECGALSEGCAQAANEVAWACLENMSELATAIPADEGDLWFARKYRSYHGDFEDNLIVAAARRAKADYIVTTDKLLLKHAPAAAITPQDLLGKLNEGAL